MVKIKVLLENTKSNNKLKEKHGLSLFIEYGNQSLLLDVGPDSKFLFNAKVLNVDVASIETLLLSHNHIDHTGGLDSFCKENSLANIYLFGDKNGKYYTKVAKFFNYPIGLKCSDKSKKRIVSLDEDFQINSTANFIKNRVNNYPKPSLNKSLYRQINGIREHDTFLHEGILVIEDNNELILFNSCSHNGVINSIETVLEVFPEKRIRAYVGGFHLCNPMSNRNEKDTSLNEFAEYFVNKDIQLYTGHCTGKYPFNYLQKTLGHKIHQIHTGMELEI
jgi:7,8-dihydropterin-6-yl-methyl-4-(beta-D-ribofuranosyl)aminobenzene 5'-phosphate synthase